MESSFSPGGRREVPHLVVGKRELGSPQHFNRTHSSNARSVLRIGPSSLNVVPRVIIVDWEMYARLFALFAGRHMRLHIVRRNDPKMEQWFRHYLVEDKGSFNQTPSYVDYLCQIHKEIRQLLS